MKLLHICLCSIVTDGLSYQDNLLPKYHRKLGLDTSIITNQYIYSDNGKIIKDNRKDYENEDGVHIYRLEIKNKKTFKSKFKRFKDLSYMLEQIHPDYIFIHGVQFLDIKIIVKYLRKNKDVKVYVDNHSDFSNSATNWLSKNILHKIIWKHYAHLIEPHVIKFYGVLPARVEFLENMYKLPKEKCELLVMGANDELVEKYSNIELRKKIRKDMKINDGDLVIVTGGKIDKFKLQTLLLMEAINNINNENIKLLIFGSIEEEIKPKFDKLYNEKMIQYLGWISEEESYKYFSIADLVVFPGRHSVYWEQVVAMGKPMICKYWEGTTHVDIGGNVKFLYNDSVQEIQDLLEDICNDNSIYYNMLKISNSEKKNDFLYSYIAKKSINN